MRPRIQPDAPSRSLKHAKRILWGLAIISVLGLATYFLAPLYIFYYVPEELPPYDIPPRPKDDTLRIAIIGDSWAEFHMKTARGHDIRYHIKKNIRQATEKQDARERICYQQRHLFLYV